MIELNLEQRREFLKNYDMLVELFGQDLVDEGLLSYSMYQLCDEYQIPLQDAYGRPAANVLDKPYHKVYISLGKKHTHYRFVNNQGWEKSVATPVTSWQVPAQYQHTHQARHIVRPALHKLRPWLHAFRLHIYPMEFYQNRDQDFYVKLGANYWKGGFDCLYVPIKAFLAGDVDAIIKRNETYFKDYTKDETVWGRMKLDPTVIRFLDLVKESANESQ